MSEKAIWPPVHIDGTELRATSEVHYRKLLALQRFMETLLNSPARNQIARALRQCRPG